MKDKLIKAFFMVCVFVVVASPLAFADEAETTEESAPQSLWEKMFVRWGGIINYQFAYDLEDDGQGEDLGDTRLKLSSYLDLKPWNKARIHLSAWGMGGVSARFPGYSMKPEWYVRVPQEAYISQSLWKFDIMAGYQTLKWGSNEFLSPTDNINPLDLRGFIDPDREDIVIPIPMVVTRFFITDFIFVEGVAIPFFQRGLFHQFHTDFALCQEGICPVEAGEDVEYTGPDPWEVDWEYGGRIRAQISDFTVELNYFKTREDFPVYASVKDYRVTYEEIIIQQRYPEYEIIGGGLAWRYKKVALRTEGMYVPERYFTTFKDFFFNKTGRLRPILYPKTSPYYSWAVEAEYSPSRRLYLLAGYSEFVLTDPPQDLLISSKYMNVALLMIRATALRERLVFKMGAIYFIQDDEYALAPRLSYQATDEVELTIGANILQADRADTQKLGGIAPISLYSKNDNVFIGVRYTF